MSLLTMYYMYTMPKNLLLAFSQGSLRGFTECARHCYDLLKTAETEEIYQKAVQKYHLVWSKEKTLLSFARTKRPGDLSGVDPFSPPGKDSSSIAVSAESEMEAVLHATFLPHLTDMDDLVASFNASPAAQSAGSNAGQAPSAQAGGAVVPGVLLSTFDQAAFSPQTNLAIPKVSPCQDSNC